MSRNERTHFFIKNISLTLYSRKGDSCCVWEMSWRRGQTAILTHHYFFLILAGLLNRGSLRAQSSLSAAGSQFGILSPTDSNWLKPSVCWLYYCLTRTCFRRSSVYLHWCISWLMAQSRANMLHIIFHSVVGKKWYWRYRALHKF